MAVADEDEEEDSVWVSVSMSTTWGKNGGMIRMHGVMMVRIEMAIRDRIATKRFSFNHLSVTVRWNVATQQQE
jgi:hypothetical protein